MQCIFIHINKTAGTSIANALSLTSKIPWHATAKEWIAKYGQQYWDETFKFTVVRNPWDKVVSHFQYRVMTNQSDLGVNPIGFNEWVKRAYGKREPFYYNNPKMFMQQVDWLMDYSGRITINYILRFENLENDFNTLCEKLGTEAILPHLKASNRGHYREYYNQIAADTVRKCFEKDIEYFGYTFE